MIASGARHSFHAGHAHAFEQGHIADPPAFVGGAAVADRSAHAVRRFNKAA